MTTRITINHDGMNLKWDIDDETLASQATTAIVKMLNTKKVTSPRRKFTPEQLREIAAAWHAAPEGARNKAVRDLLGVNRQDATNYIHRCRAVGLIGPPARRQRPSSTVPVEGDNSFANEIEQIIAQSAGDQ